MSNIETSELLQMYSNAAKTCSCAGHYKGDRNKELREQYALELKSRGITVPKDIFEKIDKNFKSSVEIPQGIFNGKGSY